MERSDQIMQKPLAETAQIMGCSELDLIFVEAIVRHAKTSFAAGMKMLSPERRYGMFALYSFCRIVDDIADDMGEPEVKQKQLQKWRDKIELLYNGKADGSVENVLLGSIQQFGLRKEDFHISLIPERCMENPSIQEVCNIMSYRALDHFRSAANYMRQCEVDAIRPAKIMAATYRFLLGKQKKLGWKKPFKRASLSTGEKVIVGMAGLMV